MSCHALILGINYSPISNRYPKKNQNNKTKQAKGKKKTNKKKKKSQLTAHRYFGPKL